jgi:ABC-2 type transport system ATP-binding protein
MSIEVKDLSFRYGKIVALDGVTMSLGEGAVGLLGPNGAGKSTLLRLLLGFLPPDRGEARILGYDIRRDLATIRRSVGYMPESDCFVAGMDAVTFTSYFGELSGMPRQEAMKRAHEVLFYVGLGEARYRLLDTYSSGMKQRLKLAQALVHDPKVLFLDEPTSNLDPSGRNEVLELIRDISANRSIQVLLSSHILADIESICRSVVILNKGRLAAEGRMEDLRAIRYSLYELRLKGDGEAAFRADLEARGSRVDETEDRLLKVYMPEGGDRMDIFRAAARTGVQIRYFVKSQTSLEDLFAGVVGVD